LLTLVWMVGNQRDLLSFVSDYLLSLVLVNKLKNVKVGSVAVQKGFCLPVAQVDADQRVRSWV